MTVVLTAVLLQSHCYFLLKRTLKVTDNNTDNRLILLLEAFMPDLETIIMYILKWLFLVAI